MAFLEDKCTLTLMDEALLQSSDPFDCSNEDLNDFFASEALNYSSQLLGKSYCFTLDANPKTIICAFTLSNDSIKTIHLPNARKKKVIKDIPRVNPVAGTTSPIVFNVPSQLVGQTYKFRLWCSSAISNSVVATLHGNYTIAL